LESRPQTMSQDTGADRQHQHAGTRRRQRPTA